MFRAFSGRNFDVFKHNQFSHQDDFPKVDSIHKNLPSSSLLLMRQNEVFQKFVL